ncbi:energy-coupling factor transporter transmembrane protein EcfT [Cutibacterium sp. WCA-380-WT-3A]|uniref:Energy-coupling factor transporter transmembrane protein EcfT n=1 Tax=Cutibacterium porci TaxID=2605781 RepID=A0A7K0J5K9_9ACTN|nr:energy-coupling factor transporter transmembrane protein EcfT [Cutibacterium porci]MSS45219.1 energy-coupling factor transporter transmembrane protein EcfT [Cutibacterium porci]
MTAFLGGYRAGSTLAHRMPVWSKYLLVVLVGVTPFFVKQWWFSLGCLVLAVIIDVTVAKMSMRTALSVGLPLWIANALILAYHCIFTTWQRGVIYVAGLLACLYIARLVTCTTDPGALMDAMVVLARPLQPLGAKPEKFALTIALMWTTIPYLLGSIGQVRDAAKARGLERSSWRFLIPMFVGAVGHALEMGEALKARGLGDEDPS